MREQDVKEAEARAAYPESKVQETNHADGHQASYQLNRKRNSHVHARKYAKRIHLKTVDPVW